MSNQPQPAGCINWQAYDTNAIWQILKDEDSAKGFLGVTSWNTVGSHLDVQEERLRYARHALAAVWPPETNESARAFLQEIDRTLASMAETRNTACDILSGLNGMVRELADARTEVQGKLADRLEASGDLAPRFLDHAEDEIDEQVRQAMARREQAFADHASKIQPPPEFKAGLGKFGEVPPPGHTGAPDTGVGSSKPGGGYSPVPVPVPHDPPAPRPGHDPFTPQAGTSSDSGPILSGAAPTLPLANPVHVSPVQPNMPGTPSLFVPGLMVGGTPTSVLGGPLDRPGTSPSPMRPAAVRGGMPSGGVIGGVAAGGSMPGAGSAPSRSAAGRSVSPSVIGGARPSPGAGAGTGTAGRPNAMMPGMQPGGRGGREEQGGTVELDPTNPWETAEGVAPVIKPDERVVRHDAGSGVIGWDR